MQNFNLSAETQYTDEQSVREEIRNALFIFQRGNFKILNVTNKPIESTANEILQIMNERFDFGGRRLQSPYRNENMI